MSNLFVCSLDLSDWGWKAEESLRETPVSLCKAVQKAEMRSLSQLDTMSVGRPFLQYQWVKNSLATSSAITNVLQGMNLALEPRQSVTVKIVLKLSSTGKGPMKSIAIKEQGCTGMARG